MTLEEFIHYSLNSSEDKKIFTLNITDEACKAIKKQTKLNICEYKFILEEKYIRHVKNYHKEDLHLLPELPNILNNFSHVEKSLTRNKQTGANEVSLVFRKKIDDDVIQMVSLRVMRDKILSLKTFFRP